jgi:histidine ammonia-lyase
LLKGYSGIRYSVLETYIKAVNFNIIPWVPEKGTVGASGDLAPLAHIALGLIGEGQVWNAKSKKYELGADVMKEFGLECIQLKAKEGLSLINGTQFMSALACEGLVRCTGLIKEGDVVAALTLEALHGSYKAFDERIHGSRPHSGQILVAKRIRSILGSGSEINTDHKNCKLVQDAYTLRCIPQVHGIVVDTIEFVRGVIQTEINSATDNPMVFENHDIVSGGNFHGEYVAKVCDYLTIAIAELGNMSERRIARMIDNQLSPHLPGFLVKEGGLNSGFMMAQVTAASLVSENKVLCHPSSSDTIPTSGNKEDHISCGGFASRKLLTVVDHVEYIVAIEMMCASQALSFSLPLKTTKCLEAVNSLILKHVPYYAEDRNLSKDIEVAKQVIQTGLIWDCASRNLE